MHQSQPNRKAFFITKDEKPIGEILLKGINLQEKSCTLSIHLQNDSVKGKGYGSWAERQVISYAFNTLGMNTIYADSVLKNTRSQHVLEKVGFTHIYDDDMFKYYRYDKK